MYVPTAKPRQEPNAGSFASAGSAPSEQTAWITVSTTPRGPYLIICETGCAFSSPGKSMTWQRDICESCRSIRDLAGPGIRCSKTGGRCAPSPNEVAASLGLEPRQADSESAVLPLHHEAI